METLQLIDLYLKRQQERQKLNVQFWAGEAVLGNNIRHLESWLSMPWSDELPHMQPWFGTGVYANAFGCEYLWREGAAPDSHVCYHTLEEVRGLSLPEWQQGKVMNMVLECIDLLKEKTDGDDFKTDRRVFTRASPMHR